MIDPETVAQYGLPGHLRAVPDEIDAADLPVTGTLPPELDGRYLRNGPNPLPGQRSGHLQAGHGMLHGVRLAGGRTAWYRNRWVRTGAFHGQPFVTPDGRWTGPPRRQRHEDDAGRVVLDAVRYPAGEWQALSALLSRADAARGFAPAAAAVGRARLARGVLDPATGVAAERQLDDRSVEFPTIDDDLTGRRSRYLYTVTGTEPRSRDRCAIVKYDVLAGDHAGVYEPDPETMLGEAVFVPGTRGPRREDDGWLLTVTTRRDSPDGGAVPWTGPPAGF